MANTTKGENKLLEEAYSDMYHEETPVMTPKPNTPEIERLVAAGLAGPVTQPQEESSEEQPEDDKMSAAISIQRAADRVKDQGGEVTQQLKTANQESEKYINDMVDDIKKS